LVALVMPVLSYAVPCSMMMPSAGGADHSARQLAAADDMPCPHHKQAASQSCDLTNALSDCLDIGMLLPSADAAGGNSLKSDTTPVAIIPAQTWEQVISTVAASRAPPAWQGGSIPYVSRLLTTQRFRV
jgi:hypothetical protein